MTVSAMDKEVKEIKNNYHIYGLECLLNAVARQYKNEPYIDKDWMLELFGQCIDRASEEVKA